jgi:hypothetical protein
MMLTAQKQQCSSKQSDMSGGVMHSSNGYSLDVFGDDRMMTSFQGICLSDKLTVIQTRTLIIGKDYSPRSIAMVPPLIRRLPL